MRMFPRLRWKCSSISEKYVKCSTDRCQLYRKSVCVGNYNESRARANRRPSGLCCGLLLPAAMQIPLPDDSQPCQGQRVVNL